MMLYLQALRDTSLLDIGPLWKTTIPGYSDDHALLHDDPYTALLWMTDKVQEIRARGWYEFKGECLDEHRRTH